MLNENHRYKYWEFRILIDLFNGWSSATSAAWASTSSWHATGHTAHVRHSTGSTSALVQLRDDGVAHALNLLLLVIELFDLGQLVGIKPLDGFVTLVSDLLHVIFRDLILHLLIIKSGLHVEAVALKTILGRDPLLLLLIISFELLGIIHHALNVLLGQTALVVGDGDLVLLSGALVASRDVQDTVGVDVERDLDLRDASWCWRDGSQVELAKEMVVLGHGPLALVHLDGDGGLVVGVGGEGLGLLGGDGGVPLSLGIETA